MKKRVGKLMTNAICFFRGGSGGAHGDVGSIGLLHGGGGELGTMLTDNLFEKREGLNFFEKLAVAAWKRKELHMKTMSVGSEANTVEEGLTKRHTKSGAIGRGITLSVWGVTKSESVPCNKGCGATDKCLVVKLIANAIGAFLGCIGCYGSRAMRLACVRIRLHSDQRYIRFTHLRNSLGAPGERQRRRAQRCRCDVAGQTSPFSGDKQAENKEKNRTGITTGIEWEKKENLAGDAKGKLLTTGSGKIKGQTGCVCGRSERANETG
jgi:hypothetical protein